MQLHVQMVVAVAYAMLMFNMAPAQLVDGANVAKHTDAVLLQNAGAGLDVTADGQSGPTEHDREVHDPPHEVSPLPAADIFPDGLLMLVMIVKNEATSIVDVIHSSMPHMDAWYIMDTGSIDGTQDLVTKTMAAHYPNKPGWIDEHPFVDFATTRNEALLRSGNRTMFKFFIDGDWYLENGTELRAFLQKTVEPYKEMMTLSPYGCTPCLPCFEREPALGGFKCASVECQACSPTLSMRIMLGTLDYYVPRVMRSTTHYKFQGVVHEVIGPHASRKIPGDTFIIVNATETNQGHSKERWYRDEKLLETEFKKDPTDSRTAFYLGQTYDLVDKPLKAYHMYWKRSRMHGWYQEAYVALHRAGRNALEAGLGFEKAKEAWLAAYEIDVRRCESLYSIANYYKNEEQFKLCSLYAKMAAQCDYPSSDALFIKGDIYNYARWDLLGICAWYTRDYDVGFKAVMKALDAYPDVRHTRKNIKYYVGKVDGAAEAWEKYKPDEPPHRDEL
mmetsp:Transcript_31108/g.81519  ORF Transcript_31108/g.81519 Transcript_31108/m.81519 type:complete len:503 (-) Transcript_31108:117-1625(-)